MASIKLYFLWLCLGLSGSIGEEEPTILFKVSGITVTFVGTPWTNSTVTITLSIDTDSAFPLRARYFGLGFQNLPTFQDLDLGMSGPNGSDYLIFHDDHEFALVEYRRLSNGSADVQPEYVSTTRQTTNDTSNIHPYSNVHRAGRKRIHDFTFLGNGSHHIYTVKMACQRGADGLADLSRPSAVMFARGHYAAHQLFYHSVGPTFRGFNRTGKFNGLNVAGRPVRLFTLCGTSQRVKEPILATPPTVPPTPPSSSQVATHPSTLCLAILAMTCLLKLL